jgi:hypothetical protein
MHVRQNTLRYLKTYQPQLQKCHPVVKKKLWYLGSKCMNIDKFFSPSTYRKDRGLVFDNNDDKAKK